MTERERVQPVTAALTAVNVIIFLIQFFYGPAARFFYEEGTLVGYAVAEQGEYWRIVTSMFLHAGTDHIFSNMLILYFVGIEVERRFGHLRMLLLYFASGIAGNLLSLAAELRMHEVWRSLGASGAVFGVVAAMAVLAVRNRRYIGRSGMQRVLFGIAFSLYSGFRTAGTNNFAHVGGFLTGVALTCLFLLSEDLRRRAARREEL